MTPSFFPGSLAYFCLFAPHPLSSLPLAAAVPQRARPCLTRRRGFFFSLSLWRKRSQAESIRLRSRKGKGKEKKPTGAGGGNDCISSHEPQDGRTGQHASKSGSLPSSAAVTHHSSCIQTYMFLSFSCCGKQSHTLSSSQSQQSVHPALPNKHFHMHTLPLLSVRHRSRGEGGRREGGFPARCEERDGIIRSRGLSPSTNYSTIWPSPNLPSEKHPGWK